MPVVKKKQKALRDIGVIAQHEFFDALRSRRVLIMLLLFIGGAIAGTLMFVEVLETFEVTLAKALAVAEPGKAGAMTTQLMRSPELVHMLARFLDDETLAKELVDLPPLALFYGWLGLMFLPALIMLTSAEAISGELTNGSLRFSLVRTARLSFSLGKLTGQTLLMLLGVCTGALAVWLTGYFSLASFDAQGTALWLSLLSMRIAVFAFAYVGLAVGLSHLTRRVPLSRALALGSLMLFAVLYGVGKNSETVREHAGEAIDTLLMLLPRSHMLALWQPSLIERLPALVMLVALGLVYFSLGYLYRARRDA